MNLLLLGLLLLACMRAASGQVGTSRGHELACIPVPLVLGDDFQTLHLECGGFISPGKASVARFSWQTDLASDASVRRTTLLVSPINGTIGGEGEEKISIDAHFTRDNNPLPTCQTKRRLVIGFNATQPVTLEPRKGVKIDRDDSYGDSGYGYGKYGEDDGYGYGDVEYGPDDDDIYEDEEEEESYYKGSKAELLSKFDEWEGPEEEEEAQVAGEDTQFKRCPHKEPHEKHTDVLQARTNAVVAQRRNKGGTPGGLNVKVKCKSANLQGPPNQPDSLGCSVRLRLVVRFNRGLTAVRRVGDQDRATRTLDDTNVCRRLTFVDTLDVLDTTRLDRLGRDTVNTQVCFPPATAAGRRRLSQAEPEALEPEALEPAQMLNPTIPAGAVWDDATQAKAVRGARYAAGIRCLPTLTNTPSGAPRPWAAVASWGGPGPTRNPNCLSCFKDGVSYAPGVAPAGWETPEFGFFTPFSFRDAAIILTDTELSDDPSIVVIFRSTVTDIQRAQWLSNLGGCAFLATGVTGSPISVTNAAAGRVCSSFKGVIDQFNRGSNGDVTGFNTGTASGPTNGLMTEVKRRLGILGPTTRVFVFGHSRGAALAAIFAAELLVEQQAGRLGTYTGPNGERAQVSLYTWGGPRVGNPDFARWIEERTFERFRFMTRFDPIPLAPTRAQGYAHWRPTIWMRQSDGADGHAGRPRPEHYCVLTPQPDLAANRQSCFISCNDVLACARAIVVPAPGALGGTRAPSSPTCDEATEQVTDRGSVVTTPSSIERDHGSYLGIDVDNAGVQNGCRVDVSVLAGGCTNPDNRCQGLGACT